MNFVKMEATGNIFLLVDARKEERDWPELAISMCHRHFGVGADGLILILPSEVADLRMRVFNPDGSEAEACGNGMRCFARYIIEEGLIKEREFKIETLAGIRIVRPCVEDGRVNRVQVDMGKPGLRPEDIPVLVEREKFDIILDYPINVEGEELLLTCLSMGNPHAVCFPGEPVSEFPLAKFGPKVENNPIFPNRVNFEIANVIGRGQIEARVWERGVGETLSCGSGASAIAVAARLHDYIDNKVDITLPGGKLRVEWDGVGEVWLTGPAERVFRGEWGE